jgi:hypothetical protein
MVSVGVGICGPSDPIVGGGVSGGGIGVGGGTPTGPKVRQLRLTFELLPINNLPQTIPNGRIIRGKVKPLEVEVVVEVADNVANVVICEGPNCNAIISRES